MCDIGSSNNNNLKIKLFEKIKNVNFNKRIIFYNELGVNEVKKEYEKYNGECLYDLIFKNIFKINEINIDNLTNLWIQGNNIIDINRSVTAGFKGIHIYLTKNRIITIVIRN